MDKARFEKNDLLSLPCPFVDMDDQRLLDLQTSETVNDATRLDERGCGFQGSFRGV
jgi:hypothetical protein